MRQVDLVTLLRVSVHSFNLKHAPDGEFSCPGPCSVERIRQKHLTSISHAVPKYSMHSSLSLRHCACCGGAHERHLPAALDALLDPDGAVGARALHGNPRHDGLRRLAHCVVADWPRCLDGCHKSRQAHAVSTSQQMRCMPQAHGGSTRDGQDACHTSVAAGPHPGHAALPAEPAPGPVRAARQAGGW